MLDHDDRVLRRQRRGRAPALCVAAGVLLWLTGIGNLVLGTLALFSGAVLDVGLTLVTLVTGIVLLVAARFVLRGDRVAVYGTLLVVELLLALSLLGTSGEGTATLVGQLLLLLLTLVLAAAAWQLHARPAAER